MKDRNTPVARIPPSTQRPRNRLAQHKLVADGITTMPEKVMDRDAFFAHRVGSVPYDVAVQAVIDDGSEG